MERALASEPPPLEALIEYGRRERRRDPERARALLEQAVERAPNDLRALALLAQLDLETGNPEAARARVEAAIERFPTAARLYLLRARLLAAEGNLEAALDDTRRALEIRPGFAEASQLQVALLSEQGELEEAIGALEALAAEDHLDPPGRVRLARMHMTLGNDERAIELLEQALRERSDLNEGKNDLAFLLTRSGVDLDRAVQLAQEARSALPDSPEVADTLGFAYLRKGLPQAALPQLEAAVELAEARGRPTPRFSITLALALKALERNPEAANALEDSLAIEGDFPDFPARGSSTRARCAASGRGAGRRFVVTGVAPTRSGSERSKPRAQARHLPTAPAFSAKMLQARLRSLTEEHSGGRLAATYHRLPVVLLRSGRPSRGRRAALAAGDPPSRAPLR